MSARTPQRRFAFTSYELNELAANELRRRGSAPSDGVIEFLAHWIIDQTKPDDERIRLEIVIEPEPKP